MLQQFSWQGSETKAAFRLLDNFNRVCVNAIQTKYPKYTWNMYENRVQTWIIHSRERLVRNGYIKKEKK